MPPIIIAVAVAAGSVAAGIGLGAAIIIGLATAAVSALLPDILGVGSFPSASDQTARQRIQRSPNAPHEWVYGKTIKSGVMAYYDETGVDNEFAHIVVILAPHECQSIGTVFFNDKPSTDHDATFFRIKKHLGSKTQIADSDLVAESSRWTTGHRIQGRAYLYIRFKFSREEWPNGIPNIRAELDGKVDIFDPRDSSTGYSTNAALCIRDYLTSPLAAGATALELNESSFITAANVSDELVTTINAGTEKRFEINGALSTATPISKNLQALATAMGGNIGNTLTGFTLIPGVYQGAPTLTLTVDDFTSDLSFRSRTPRRQLFNTVKGQFIDPQSDYLPVDFPEVTNSAWVIEDNSEAIPKDIDLPFTISAFAAQRLGRLTLARNRNGLVFDISTKAIGLELTINQNVGITVDDIGWAAKEFRVIDFKYSTTKGVTLTLKEESSLLYDFVDGILTDYTPPLRSTLPLPGLVQPVTGLSVASVQTIQMTGLVQTAAQVNWTAAAFSAVRNYEVQWAVASSGVWQSLFTSEISIKLLDVAEGQSFDFRVRTIAEWGSVSAWATSTDLISEKLAAPPDPTGLIATGLALRVQLDLTYPFASVSDVSHFEVFESDTNDRSLSALVAIISAPSDSIRIAHIVAGTKFYWIRAFDTTGNASGYFPASAVAGIAGTSLAGLVGPAGADGANGQSDFVGLVYRRAASAPATPTGGQYDFATNTLTAPTSWFTAPPAGTDPLYVSTASFSVVAPTTVDSTTTWTSPDVLVQDGDTGATGGAGTSVHVANIFRRASSAPATPAVDDGSYNFTTKVLTPPAGWSVSPPAGGEPLYVSTGSFSIVGITGTDSTVTWTAPDLLLQDGSAGSSALNIGRRMDRLSQWWSTDTQTVVLPTARWSVISGSGGPVTDNAMRVEENSATSRGLFSERIAIDNTRKHRVSVWVRQPVGDRNNYLLVALYNSAGANIVAATSGATGWTGIGAYFYHNIVNADFPTAWTKYTFEFGGDAAATIPSTAVTMAIGGLFNRDGTNNTQVDLQDYKVEELALVPVTSQLTNPAHVVDAANDGTGYSLTGAGGTHNVAEGTTDRTSAATHSITGGATKNGLTISVTSAGVYSLSGASWTSDSETFTLRSVYGGVTNDKVYTISKAKQGAAGGSGAVQLAGKALTDTSSSPTDSEVGYQLQSTGLERSYTGVGNPYITIGDWLLSGAAGDYECMLTVNSGTAPAGSATGSWLNLGTVRAWTLTDTTSIGGVISNNCTIQIRLASTQTVKASATVTMSVEESV